MARQRVMVPADGGAASAPPLDAAQALNQDAVEASTKLVETLETADAETDRQKSRQVVFDNANAAKETQIDDRFPALVTKTFAPVDWLKVIDRYEKWLELGDRRTDEGFIRKAHEEGPSILGSLHDSYYQVKYARAVWEMENDVLFGAMRVEAEKVLEKEKERKIRTKTITEADVAQKCASMFPDEWVRQESKRLQFKLAEDRTKSCIDVAGTRCRHLDTMMGKLR